MEQNYNSHYERLNDFWRSLILSIEKWQKSYSSAFPSFTKKDMFNYIKPLLKKSPDNVILHAAANDSVNNPSRTVLENTLSLKHSAETLLANARVCISNLITRADNGKPKLTVKKTCQ